MTAPQIRVTSAQSTLRTAVARALATALVTGIDNCAEEDRPLTQLQEIDLATMHVMAYQEALDACGTVQVESMLSELIKSEASACADTRSGGETQ